MAESILYGLAQEVLKKLGSTALDGIASAWGFKIQLDKLKNTIDTIKDVLLDAEEKQVDSLPVRRWLERLSTVVYAADDLFDEFNFVVAQKELMDGHKLTKEVRTFFSHSNQVALACKFSQKIKRIRGQLDDIVKDGTQFHFVHHSPERGSAMSRRKRDQSISYVDADEVVGREDNKKDILEMLLESSSSRHDEGLPVIPIVGMGGMGKTTLAQLIYNDPEVKEYFDLRLWVCVSDVFDIKTIIDKLLKSATNKETPNLEMDQLQGLLQREVADKKYLLVLDDVWNEERRNWLDVRNLLKIGRKGSKILLTTRSKEVADVMGTSRPYDLQGLSEEKSWELFEKMAFISSEEAQQKPHLVEIGKQIVKKCGHVPIAIRTLGSLLYAQEERKWLLVKDTSFAKIHDDQSDIMNILKHSYIHLLSPLKNCFAYCALFPKDYEFDKEMLKDLWIAEGFVVPHAIECQSQDEAAEVYFHDLLQRGFFQNIKRNEWGDIKSCKMHDLMHDLAQEVSGAKSKVAGFNDRDFGEKCVHLSLGFQLTSTWEIPNSMLNMKLLRTFLLPEQIKSGSASINDELLMRFRSLRVLDLSNMNIKSMPSSIGKRIHLRYLNLSMTPIESLPNSVTGLWNLQALNLRGCSELKTLPLNLGKLINLRSLNVDECDRLSHMPSGLEGLTSLNSLPKFIVGTTEHTYKSTAKVSDLKNLNNLRGSLFIAIQSTSTMLEAREANLSNKHGLTELIISLPYHSDCNNDDEAVLEDLKPPTKIKSLKIYGYEGEKVPSWARMHNLCTTLPSLVHIHLWSWCRCQQLPAFSQLPFLKCLELGYMKRVEYIEESNDVCGVPSSSSSIFFPSLEQLDLNGMHNLKGWWKQVEAIVHEDNNKSESASNELAAQKIPTTFIQFSKLSKLSIMGCPKLRMLPLCPNVEDLTLLMTNETLSVLKMATSSTSISSVPSSAFTGNGLKLEKLLIGNVEELMSLPNHCLHQLSFLEVYGDDKLESTERLEDVFATLSSSLRSLEIRNCHKLRSIAKGIEHLTALKTLGLYNCSRVEAWGDEKGMPWKALSINLRSLSFEDFPQLVGLPRGLQHLSNLHSLSLIGNHKLEEVPEWISCLSSLEYLQLWDCPKLRGLPEAFSQLSTLNHLEIIECPGLEKGCQGPNGSEWPKIKHIRLLSVRDQY